MASGVRPSSQNERLDCGPDPEREHERAQPDRAAERKADCERCDLERGARDADPDAEAPRGTSISESRGPAPIAAAM